MLRALNGGRHGACRHAQGLRSAQIFRGGRHRTGPRIEEPVSRRPSTAEAPHREDTLTAIFFQGAVTNVLNPKVARDRGKVVRALSRSREIAT
jgi:hypothetical protein